MIRLKLWLLLIGLMFVIFPIWFLGWVFAIPSYLCDKLFHVLKGHAERVTQQLESR